MGRALSVQSEDKNQRLCRVHHTPMSLAKRKDA